MSAPDTRTAYPMLAAAVAAVGVEAASNALFAYDLGAWVVPVHGVPLKVDGALLAGASVAIAVMQAHSATAIVHHKQPVASLAGLMLGVGLALSVGSMSAHMLKLQQHSYDIAAAATARHAAAESAQRVAKATYDRAAAEDAALRAKMAAPAPRSVDTIDADVPAARPGANAWKATKECTALLHVPDLASACKAVLDLRAERAAAVERATLAVAASAAAGALMSARDGLREADEKLAATPKPETPWPVRTFLAQTLPWLMALATITLSTFGFAHAVRPVKLPASPTPAPAPAGGTQVPPPPRTVRPSSLATLLEGLATGAATVPGCNVDAGGWIDASQRQLAKALNLSPATVSRQLRDLRHQNYVATKIDNGRELLKWVKP